MAGNYYIGLMSGTSVDGVDAALIEVVDTSLRLIGAHSEPIPAELQARLRAVQSTTPLLEVARLDAEVGELFASSAKLLLANENIDASQVAAIGSHGQTIWHAPGDMLPFSWQIGDPNRIAERTGITTVADFRRRDLAAGGQGAPLAPIFHRALFGSDNEDRAAVNIGGIANVTVLPAHQDREVGSVIGFDTGPGNALLDAWARQHIHEAFDRNGAWGSAGHVDEGLLTAFLADDYFSQAPPKSTGREHFNMHWVEKGLNAIGAPIAPRDVQATLLQLTVATIAGGIKLSGLDVRRVIVCGGGAHNAALMERLAKALDGVDVVTSTAHNIAPDWVEAAGFAWLASQTLERRPGNVPSVTGARHPAILGGIYPA